MKITMTKEELLKRLEDIDGEIKALNTEKGEVKKKLIFTRVTSINRGSIWHPKYEYKTRKETLVCTRIEVGEWNYNRFRYGFKRIKPNGELTSNNVHGTSEDLKWLDEYYDFKKYYATEV